MTTRYAYLRSPERQVTIARRLSKDRTQVEVGVSISHPSDNNSKKMGRMIAENRLNSQKGKFYFEIPLDEDEAPLRKVMEFLSNYHNISSKFNVFEDKNTTVCVAEELSYMASRWLTRENPSKFRRRPIA